MKTPPILLVLVFAVSFLTAEEPEDNNQTAIDAEYDNRYCKDPIELDRWAKLLENNPKSDDLHALHALWMGLCVKVESRQLTVDRANAVFERARGALLWSIEREKKQQEGKDNI